MPGYELLAGEGRDASRAYELRVGSSRLRTLRNDVLLATTALLHGAAVMTRNHDDFAAIAAVLAVRVVASPA